MDVVTRIAPSPTGHLHIGTARSALFNYLWAKHNKGTFVIRIEDTDKERDKPEYEKSILESLKWLGIEHDVFARQSENIESHKKAIQKLIEKDAAYLSKEEAKDGSGREVEVVRFRNPNKEITFNDLVRGDITVDTTDLGDFVIARSLEDPLHHLVVIVDDAEQGITLAMRGEDLLSNTPRQILIREALELPSLAYLHLPLILNEDKTKLSKRKNAVSIIEFKEKGYLPEALVNYIAFLGWNPGTEEELFSMDQLIEQFTLDNIQKHGAVFNETKLRWFNREYLEKLTGEEFAEGVKPFFTPDTLSGLEKTDRFLKLVPELRERIDVYSDVSKMEEEGEFAYLIDTPTYDTPLLLWKKNPEPQAARECLEGAVALLDGLDGNNWNKDTVKESIWEYVNEKGKGDVLWPMRVALSGREKSPDPFTLAGILGKDEAIIRIKKAIEQLG